MIFVFILQLEKHDAKPNEGEGKFRTEAEMQQEATHLAKYFTQQ